MVCRVGRLVGTRDGRTDGIGRRATGLAVGCTVGVAVGARVGAVGGRSVISSLGANVGRSVAAMVGFREFVGPLVLGRPLGCADTDGKDVGRSLGCADGDVEMSSVGARDRETVGCGDGL